MLETFEKEPNMAEVKGCAYFISVFLTMGMGLF